MDKELLEKVEKAAHAFAKENSRLDKNEFPYGYGFQSGASFVYAHYAPILAEREKRIRVLMKELVLYADAMDRVYEHNEACRAAVLRHFGTLHTPIVMDARSALSDGKDGEK